jgi:hypothetical protein
VNIIWILLWLLLSAFVLGAFVWSTKILFLQKRAWSAFAAKHKLNYDRGGTFISPAVNGNYQGFRLNVYSEEQQTADARGVRFRSVVEMMGKSFMPMSGAVASGDLVNLIEQLETAESLVPVSSLWKNSFAARTSDTKVMKQFLTDANLEVLNRLMKNERSSFLLIFDNEDLLLRYETGDPLHDTARLEKLVRVMADMYQALERNSTGVSSADADQDETVPEKKEEPAEEKEKEKPKTVEKKKKKSGKKKSL